MFAKRIGRSLRQPLNHIVAVNHALIKRSWFSSEVKANTITTDPQLFSGGFKGLVEKATEDRFAGQDTDLNPGAYIESMFENIKDFIDRVVVDVGADTGILSLLAVQAGAKHVYALGASEEADYLCKLGSPYAERITVIKGEMEDIELPEKADILISKPMGTLIVHREGLKDFVTARDRFLNPNGKMFPSFGRVHVAPFTDERHGDDDKCAQPVVEAYHPTKVLVTSEISQTIDFNILKEEDVYNIDIPLKFTASVGATIHGLAWRFDVYCNGSTIPRWLPTAYGLPSAYWQQFRCFLSKPIHIMPGQEITGRLHFVAHCGQIFYVTLSAEQGGEVQTSSGKLDLDQVYYASFENEDYDKDEPTDHLVKTKDLPIQGNNEQVCDLLWQQSEISDGKQSDM